MHWRHLNAYFDCSRFFDPAIASHQINLAKPDKACFEYAIAALDCPAEDIWFFDDTELNIKAAQKCGMQARLIDPADGVLPTLRELGLIS